MTIQITRPEVESLIEQRLRSGAFSDTEDMIFQALSAFEPPACDQRDGEFDSLSDLLLHSPFTGANLDLERSQDYPAPR